jgi:hypothetical protein
VTDIYAGGAYVNYSILMNALGASTTQVIGGFFTSGWYMESTVDDWTNWKNIQLTWDGTNLTTYINGSFYHQINHVGVISGGDSVGVRVGRRWDAPEYVTGEIGEVRIYSRALTAGEVSEAYAQSAPFFAA